MPISATGTSSRPVRRSSGFSLLELLVVLVIIGVFFGAVVMSTGIVENDRGVEQEVRRLENVIDLVREEALMQSRDYGLLFGNDGYRFYVYDYDERAWLEPTEDDLLAPHALGENLEFELEVEDRELMVDPEQEQEQEETRDTVETPQPQVMILSSGELTPFEAVVRRETDATAYRLVAELNGTIEVERESANPD